MIATKSWVIDLLKKFNKKKDVYSTDEQRIGTWIDGRPIYRKTFSNLTYGTKGSTWTVINIDNVPSIDFLISSKCFSTNASISRVSNAIDIKYEASKLYYYNAYSISSGAADTLVIEYTKTTD